MKSWRLMQSESIRTNTYILCCFVLFLSTYVLYWFPRDFRGDGLYIWVYTDWLIDYSNGFTRRGLAGELVRLAAPYIPAYSVAALLSWLIYGVVVLGYVTLCLRSRAHVRPLCLVALLFMPSLLPFYVYDHGALGRKETIGFLILVVHLLLLTQRTGRTDDEFVKQYATRLVPVTVVLLSLHIFVHEASFLLFLPVHVAITWSALSSYSTMDRGEKLRRVMLLYLPVFVSFLLVCGVGRRGLDVAQGICQQWEAAHALPSGSCHPGADKSVWVLPAALGGLTWSMAEAVSVTRSLSLGAVLAWLMILSLFGILTVRYCAEAAFSIAKNVSPGREDDRGSHCAVMAVKYLLVPLLISVPVGVLAPDFGRWFAVACINYAMISLSIEMNHIEVTLSRRAYPLGTLTDKWRLGRHDSPEAGAGIGSALVLLFVIFYIRLPHCCIRSTFLAEPLRSVARDVLSIGGAVR